MKHIKIAIVGMGHVGASVAYALILKNIASEILLVDRNEKKCEGEARDLSDALPFSETASVHQASLQDASQADIIIITAGAAQEPGQTRLDLIENNKQILLSLLTAMKPIQANAILLLVTNPVDALSYFAVKHSGLPENQVIGSGTLLDSQRLRRYLSKELNIGEASIHAYVLGEHGNSQFVAWSHASIFGTPIAHMLSKKQLDEIATRAMKEAYEIIDRKGSTYYGVGACVAEICENIVYNQHRVMPISSYHKELGICLSLPAVLGENGVEKVLGLELPKDEQDELMKSVETLKSVIRNKKS